MHASVASLSSSSEQQQHPQPVRHPQLLQPRTALPSLASLRMHTPPPFAEHAPSSSAQQTGASYGAGRNSSMSSASSSGVLNSSRASCSSNGASNNNGCWKNPILYKTTICDNWAAKKPCKYGSRCWYAHGFGELRFVPRLDQLPEGVREALFVEPALARAFFQEMTSLDAGYASTSAGGSSSSSTASRSESRASTMSSSSSLTGSCRLSMSPSSTMSDVHSPPTNELETLMYSPPASYRNPLGAAPAGATASDRRAKRWAPGAMWSEGAETPRASRTATAAPATVPLASPLITSDYRLFDASHPLSLDLSFLRDN